MKLVLALVFLSATGCAKKAADASSDGTTDAATDGSGGTVVSGEQVGGSDSSGGGGKPDIVFGNEDGLDGGSDGSTPDAVPTIQMQVPVAVGWTDAASAPLAFGLALPAGASASGLVFECRSAAGISIPSAQAFAPCDGATGTTLSAKPERNVSTPEGTYTIEARVRRGTETGASVTKQFYVHESLNAADACTPAVSDDAFFQAAAGMAFIAAPTTVHFGAGTQLKAPFVKVEWAKYEPAMGTIPTPAPGMLTPLASNVKTLRHVFLGKTIDGMEMILVRRAYPSRIFHTCSDRVSVGVKVARTQVDCEAMVFTAFGRGVCLQTEMVGGVAQVKTPTPLHTLHYGGTKLGDHGIFSHKIRVGETTNDAEALVLPD